MNTTLPELTEEISFRPGPARWQRYLHEIIFGSETPAGKWFDLILLVVIVTSILAVMLESVEPIQSKWGPWLDVVEWVITILFSAEFLARLACVLRPPRYAFSFFGIVDIVSILPTYLELFFTGAHTLATIRTLRLLRVFRVLKMGRHLQEASSLLQALRTTWPKITVFLTVIFCSIVIFGTAMYLVEAGEESGFDNIPVSVYWAIVTMTTVGYGDIAPVTSLGKFIAALIMLFGYAIIIVPTGIFSAEVISKTQDAMASESRRIKNILCKNCGQADHPNGANFCNRCGTELEL